MNFLVHMMAGQTNQEKISNFLKVYTAQQMRSWDQFTMKEEGISSLTLMERAARACVKWMNDQKLLPASFLICCGRGNNGGDGLAIAALLMEMGSAVQVLLAPGEEGTPDFQSSLARVQGKGHQPVVYTSGLQFELPSSLIIIDALLGTGSNRPATGEVLELISLINSLPGLKLSIDLPSGLIADAPSDLKKVIRTDYTLSFQTYKKALLMQENAESFGQVIILDIGLSDHFQEEAADLIGSSMIQHAYRPRSNFSHKGTNGHALLIGGSRGRIGAISMAAHACLRGGAGLTTVACPGVGLNVLQIAHPEAMVLPDSNENHITKLPEQINKYRGVAMGPGLGQEADTRQVLRELLKQKPQGLILDADALNIFGQEPDLLNELPENTILTPHPKEFDRMFGNHASDFQRTEAAVRHAVQKRIIIVLKSHHTLVALPTGKSYYNMTGNAGMAKGGSGDVLTGLLASLLAQGYSPDNAALMGVYIHGLAGDFAAAKHGRESMLPTDLVLNLKEAFRTLSPGYTLPDQEG